jgi:predicted RND superfamily exporter protein
MDQVFGYFVSIGAGLALGIALVVLPIYWIIQKVKNRRVKRAQF